MNDLSAYQALSCLVPTCLNMSWRNALLAVPRRLQSSFFWCIFWFWAILVPLLFPFPLVFLPESLFYQVHTNMIISTAFLKLGFVWLDLFRSHIGLSAMLSIFRFVKCFNFVLIITQLEILLIALLMILIHSSQHWINKLHRKHI